MKTILFDIDGVLARFVEGFTSLANTLYGNVPMTTTEQMLAWDGFPGMTTEMITKTWDVILQDQWFWSNLNPAVSNKVFERLNRLNRDNTVYFVTSRVGLDCKRQTELWLSDYGIAYPTVILSSRKASVAQALRVTHSLEDMLTNAVNLADVGVTSYLLDRPYNQTDVDYGINRVYAVDEFLNAMEEE